MVQADLGQALPPLQRGLAGAEALVAVHFSEALLAFQRALAGPEALVAPLALAVQDATVLHTRSLAAELIAVPAELVGRLVVVALGGEVGVGIALGNGPRRFDVRRLGRADGHAAVRQATGVDLLERLRAGQPHVVAVLVQQALEL